MMASSPRVDAPSFAYLVVLGGPRRGVIYHLLGGQIRLGRAPDRNDVVLGDDPAISGSHAILWRRPDGAYDLMDMGSTNGSFVNGEPVTRQRVRNNDRITLGRTELLFKQLG